MFLRNDCYYAILPEEKYNEFKKDGYTEKGMVDLYEDKLVFYKKNQKAVMLGNPALKKGMYDFELRPWQLRSVEKMSNAHYFFI